MKLIGNILWLIFGGIETAVGYFTGSFALFCTIVGIPFALQTLKLGMLCLWPFGAKIHKGDQLWVAFVSLSTLFGSPLVVGLSG